MNLQHRKCLLADPKNQGVECNAFTKRTEKEQCYVEDRVWLLSQRRRFTERKQQQVYIGEVNLGYILWWLRWQTGPIDGADSVMGRPWGSWSHAHAGILAVLGKNPAHFVEY